MAQKNAVYQVDNGSGFDEIHFKTNEEVIVGYKHSLMENGYRKLPGGLILQWGKISVVANQSGIVDEVGNFPIQFPNYSMNIIASVSGKNSNFNGKINIELRYNTGFRYVITGSSPNLENSFYWFAIGY